MKKNITSHFSQIYSPVKLIALHQKKSVTENDYYDHECFYVEAYDLGKDHRPINAHPLNEQEIQSLAKILETSTKQQNDHLISRDLLPNNVLHVNHSGRGTVCWYTPAQRVNLLFSHALTIPSGPAHVPPLLWKATPKGLSMYALKTSSKPTGKTVLHRAPFFNIYSDGRVCMGNVEVEDHQQDCLENFIAQWQAYFWQSYFTHTLQEQSLVQTNIVNLWNSQVNSNTPFPLDQLTPTGQKLKDILK